MRPNEACANCGAGLHGEYCAVCGQKRFVEADRRFGHLMQQFVEAATDLDGRFWGTLRALLFQPGRLSRDYIDGRRARWMPPIGLFLLVNVICFFFAPQSDFTVPFEWEMPGQIVLESYGADSVPPEEAAQLRASSGPFYSSLLGELVERRVQARDAAARATANGARGYGYRDYRQAYDAKVPEVSKALTITHVPFLALALMLMFRRSRRYYAEHFVVTLHLVAFYMAVILLLGYSEDFLHLFMPPADWHNALVNWAVRAVLAAYIVTALHRAYSKGWAWSAGTTLGLFAAYALFNFCLYRPMLFLTVFALT